jgi:L-fucose isomerase
MVEDKETMQKNINFLIDKKIDTIIFLIGLWPSPSIAIDAIEKLNKHIPVILWAFDDLNVLSLVPTCQFHGAFDDMGIKHLMIYSDPEKPEFYKKIIQISKASSVVNNLRGMNLGIYGGRYMHMYTGVADPIQIKKLFGLEITHIDEFCLAHEADKIDKQKVKDFKDDIINKFGKITVPADVLEKSIRLYFATRKLNSLYNFDFASVKCMTEFQSLYCSHCLSVSQHINEGFIISCEGDINAAITMQILKLLSDSPAGFGDIYQLNEKENILTLANCGTFATDFAKSPEDVVLNEQYKDLVPGSGTGTIMSFVCKSGEVTLARLGRINNKYVMQISSGNAVYKSKKELTGFINMPHIFINLKRNPKIFLQNTRANHLHWVYGTYENELVEICRILNIEPIVC